MLNPQARLLRNNNITINQSEQMYFSPRQSCRHGYLSVRHWKMVIKINNLNDKNEITKNKNQLDN